MRFFVASLLFLPLAGCAVELLTTTAIQGELAAQSAQQATRQLNHAKDTQADLQIGQAIRSYQAEHGANPPSLEALVPEYLYSLPEHAYDYNPATAAFSRSTGQVQHGQANPGATLPGTSPQANPVPPGDVRDMMRMREAINAYGGATGFYPPTLDALVPHYLDAVPMASNGEPYFYNNQDGDLTHPARVGQPTVNYTGGGTGGYTSNHDPNTAYTGNTGGGASSIDDRQRRNAAQFGGVSTGAGNPAGATPNIGATRNRVQDSLNRSVSGRQ